MKTSSAFLSVVTTLAMAGVLCLTPELALAQNSDEWVKPMVSLVDTLRSGAVTLGVIVVGLCIVGRGLMMALSANPDWAKIGIIVLGGFLIMAGPAAIGLLLESVQ